MRRAAPRSQTSLALMRAAAATLGLVLGLGLAAPAHAADSVTFVALSLEKLPSRDAIVVRGTLAGVFTRPWPPVQAAAYKVPVWLVYPLHPGRWNRSAVIEPMHPTGGNDFLGLLSRNTQEFNTVLLDPDAGAAELDLVRLLDGADVLWPAHALLRGPYAYATTVTERALLNVYRAAPFQSGPFQGVLHGIPIDQTFVIPRASDRAIVTRDLAKLVRDGHQTRAALQALVPADQAQALLRARLLDGCGSAGCGASHVLAGGFSSQAALFRDLQFMELNSGFGQGPAYADGFGFGGLVFDGVLLGGVRDNTCSDYFLLPGDPFYLCSGAPLPGEGKTLIVNTEDDVQFQPRFPFFTPGGPVFLGGFSIRGSEGANDDRNYRTYEVAGASHLSTVVFDPVAAGLVSVPPETLPSYVDRRPVFRAMLENLRLWVQRQVPPPRNALLELGQQQIVALEPAFPFPPPPDPPEVSLGGLQPFWVPPALTPPAFDRARQYDLMIEGGVRLPHVRTTIRVAGVPVSFGGPLGVARGFRCNNLTPLTGPFSCPSLAQDQGPFLSPGFLFGDFIPYRDPGLQAELAAFGLPNPCALYYPTRAHYRVAVRLAALHAASERWVPLEDVDDIVAAAEQKTQELPGCVPP